MAQPNNGVHLSPAPYTAASSGFPLGSGTPAPSSTNNAHHRHSYTNTAAAASTNSNSNSHSNHSYSHSHSHLTTHRTSPLPETYAALTSSVASFLAVSIHQILYLRAIYPQATFLPVRHFNHPVRQSRHPRVCTWVTDACAAVETQLLKCTVAAVSVVILSVRTNRPLERYTFDMTQIPEVEAGDVNTPFQNSAPEQQQQQPQQQQSAAKGQARPAPIDLEAQFRAVLARLASACARLTPLPRDEEYTPTLHIVLRNGADAPAGVTKEEQLWIAAEPGKLEVNGANGSQPDNSFEDVPPSRLNGTAASKNGRDMGGSRGRAKTVPVRTVDAGQMKLEVWVEEAKGKFEELDRIRSEHPP
ncbi:hypothetical protein AJ79_05240 [Helicocarpus griseus UAMH5409]|uniref:HORMA domain-containing protein n=1 Tax=Helicocarpus griseus UAMH5409 TaxID=1447875 RepID=A0A2B7XPK9_9EURO|nr:hypothetical protein AJ79_05240 [Helicocarpus griseus UAMH5409]